MSISRQKLSLRGLSLSSATWYACVAFGWSLIAWAVWQVATTDSVQLAPALVMTGILVAALEVLPLVQGRGHDPQGVVMSTAFAMAMLFLWGVWPAVIVVAIGSIAADVRSGKQWWKIVFNPGQYALSMAASYLVVRGAGVSVSLAHPLTDFHTSYLWWMALAWVAYFVLNLALVCGVLAWTAPITEIALR